MSYANRPFWVSWARAWHLACVNNAFSHGIRATWRNSIFITESLGDQPLRLTSRYADCRVARGVTHGHLKSARHSALGFFWCGEPAQGKLLFLRLLKDMLALK